MSLLRACEMPRIVMKELPGFCVCTIVMFGVSAMKSCGFSMPAAAISAAVNALICAGASTDASARMRAVTMISSRPPLGCANTGAAINGDSSSGMRARARGFHAFIDSPRNELVVRA